MKKFAALSLALVCALPFSSYAANDPFQDQLDREKVRKALEANYDDLSALDQAANTIIYGVMNGRSGHFEGKDYKSKQVKNHDYNFYQGKLAHTDSKITLLEGHLDHAYTAWPDDLITYAIITNGKDVLLTDFKIATGSHALVQGITSSVSIEAKGVGVGFGSDSAQNLIDRDYEVLSKSSGRDEWEKVSIQILEKAVLKAHQAKFSSN